MLGNVNSIIYFSSAFNCFRMLVGATSSIYLITQGMTVVELGVLKSIQSLVFFSLDIPTSYLADKYSRKYAIIIACLFGASWLIITGVATSISYLFFAEILNSISLTIVGGVTYSYIIDNAGDAEDASLLLNRINKLQFFFMACSSLLGSVIYTVNPKLPWLLSGSLCLLLSIIGCWMLPKPIVIKSNQKTSWSVGLKSIRKIDKDFFWEGANLAVLLVIFQVILQYWQVMIDNVIMISDNGLIYGIIFFLILLAQSASGYLFSFYHHQTHASLSIAVVTFLSFIGLGFFSVFGLKIYFMVLIVVIFGIIQTAITLSRSHYHTMAASQSRSVYESIVTTLSRLLAIFLLPALAYLSDLTQWGYSFIILALLSLINVYRCCSRINRS